MIVEKLIQTKVHIDDPNLLYSGDIESVIMDNLRQRFEGTCYMSCLILEVLEIRKFSNFIFSKQRQDGSASSNVNMRVKGIVIKKGEVIPDCTVMKIDKDGHIICKNKHSAIYIRASKALQSIKEGQTIAALAGDVKYKIFAPAISVNALPFIPIVRKSTEIVYKVKVQKSDLIDKMLNVMKDEIEKNTNIDTEIYKFFMDLMYPYKSQKLLKEHKGKVEMIVDITSSTGSELYISQPDWLPMDKPSIVSYKDIKIEESLGDNEIMKIKNGIAVDESYETAMGYIIHRYIEHMVALRGLCECYNTMKKVKASDNIWDIYKKYRH